MLPRTRACARSVSLTTAGLVLVLFLSFQWVGKPVDVVISLWQPSFLFGTMLALQTFPLLQPLVGALVVATCSAIGVQTARSEESPPRLYATSLVLLAAGLMALWSANILTLIVSWMIYDLVYVLGYTTGEGSAQGVVRRLVLSSLATLCLWTGALLSGGGVDVSWWPLMTVGDTAMIFWTMAGILRLWIYPFHLAAPFHLRSAAPLATVLLLNPVIGWGLWVRLTVVNGGSVPGGELLSTLAAITWALGGVLAWTCKPARRALPWMGMGTAGATLLAAAMSSERAIGILVAGGVAWILGMSVLNLSITSHREWSGKKWLGIIPALLGGAALLGLPATPSFVAAANLIGRFTGNLDVWRSTRLGEAFLGNLLFVPSLVRYVSPLMKHLSEPADESASDLLAESPPPQELVTPSELDPPAEEDVQAEGSAWTVLHVIQQRWTDVFQTVQRWWAVMQRWWGEISLAVGLGLPALLLVVTGLFPPVLEGGRTFSTVWDSQFPSFFSLAALPGLLGWGMWAISLGLGGLLAWQDGNLRPKASLLFDALHDFLCLEWLYEALLGALGRGLNLLRWADEVVGGAGALLWTWLLFLLILLIRGIE